MRRKFFTVIAMTVTFALSGTLVFGSGGAIVGRQRDGTVITPLGQRLRPSGTRIELDGRPNDLTISPDESTIAVTNLTSLSLIDRATHRVASFPYPGAAGRTGTAEAERGIVYSPDASTIYVATHHDAIQRFDVVNRAWLSPFTFAGNGIRYETFTDTNQGNVAVGALPNDLRIAPDGARLYVALNATNQVAEVDAHSGAIVASVATGIAPTALALRGRTLVVLNEGGAFPSASNQLVRVEARTHERISIEPSGVARGGTAAIVDTRALQVQRTVALGHHPVAALFLDDRRLVVAEANDDTLAMVDVVTGRVSQRVSVRLPGDGGLGAQPQALGLSRDGKTLYVALGGANALALFAVSGGMLRFRGALPTDWYPGAIGVFRDGTVAVSNIKGIGTLADTSNGGPAPDRMPSCGINRAVPIPTNGRDVRMYRGSIALIPPEELRSAGGATTATTVALANAGTNVAGHLPKLDHVFLVVRENRTYDQVMGDLPQGNGDPRLTNYPRRVTPNAHSLAEEYVLLDNFYSAGTQSADGHQWIAEGAASEYIERAFPLFPRAYPKSGDDPLAYAGAGFLWTDALRHGKTVRDYGEFAVNDFSPSDAKWNDFWLGRDGAASPRVFAHSEVPDIDKYVDHRFAGFTVRVPDQVRIDEFGRDFATFERSGHLPNLILMSLGDDLTAGLAAGFPKPCSMIADNDLAVGRLVDIVSHSRFWKSSVIFVTEDDSQDGFDHIDGHRQVALAIGPYVKRHTVVSAMYSQLSFLRTAEALLRIPPIGRFDAAAPVMNAIFSDRPDTTPYQARDSNFALDDVNQPVSTLHGERKRLALDEKLWFDPDEADSAPEGRMPLVLWFDATSS
jgi:DNA-binding beta-propeller fold protein YncE